MASAPKSTQNPSTHSGKRTTKTKLEPRKSDFLTQMPESVRNRLTRQQVLLILAMLVIALFIVYLAIADWKKSMANRPKIEKVCANVENLNNWLVGLKIWSDFSNVSRSSETQYWIQLSETKDFNKFEPLDWEREGDEETEDVDLQPILGTKLNRSLNLYGSEFFLRAGCGADLSDILWSEPYRVKIEERK